MTDQSTDVPLIQHTYAGIVHPERAAVWVSGAKAEVLDASMRPIGNVMTLVNHSQVLAQVFVRADASINHVGLKFAVERWLRYQIDAFSLSDGCGYDIEIVSYQNSGMSTWEIFGVFNADIKKLADESGVTFKKVMQQVNGRFNPLIARMTADFREAIRNYDDAPFHCYRAIESARNAIAAKSSVEEIKAWELLRKICEVERADIDRIKEIADKQRHGYVVLMENQETSGAMKLAWKVIVRTIEFLDSSYAEIPQDKK